MVYTYNLSTREAVAEDREPPRPPRTGHILEKRQRLKPRRRAGTKAQRRERGLLRTRKSVEWLRGT